MKAITGNALTTGHVVYLGADGLWKDNLSKARVYKDDEAEQALLAANSRVREIAGVYLIEVTQDAIVVGREALHEIIRSQGPTMRPDLGKQSLRAGVQS